MHPKHLLLFIFSTVQALSLLLPLYVYPSNSGTWNYFYKIIAEYHDVHFDIVINPNSGPGGRQGPGYNNEYIAAVAKLNTFHNVHLFGYVPIAYGARSKHDVNQDTAYWAAWNTYSGPENISLGGIFFDQVPNEEGEAGRHDVAYMADVTAYANALFKPLLLPRAAPLQTYYNLGTYSLHPEYFGGPARGMADYVGVYGEFAGNYSNAVLHKNVPADPAAAARSSILLHDFVSPNYKLSPALVKQWLHDWKKAGLASGNIFTHGYSEADTRQKPADLESVAQIFRELNK